MDDLQEQAASGIIQVFVALGMMINRNYVGEFLVLQGIGTYGQVTKIIAKDGTVL